MESNSNHQEESNEEVDQSDNDLGVGRSYECVFCKRGFNTAQALGGHMNIHRKDRGGVRNKSTSTKQGQVLPRLCHHRIIPSPDYTNNLPANRRYESQFSYAAAYGVSAATSSRDHQQPFNPLVIPDWRLSLEFTRTTTEDLEEDASQKPELDLELRLGYDS